MGLLQRLIDWLWPSPQPQPEPQPPNPNKAQGLVDAHNDERVRRGYQPLARDARLDLAAQGWANWMAEHGRMMHGSYTTRIADEGVQFSAAGENVAYGYSTVRDVMAGWMASRGHRANILNDNFDAIGVGIATSREGSVYWCVDFVKRYSGPPRSWPNRMDYDQHDHTSSVAT